jgi:signal transduction protein with GAF and PtsI domain
LIKDICNEGIDFISFGTNDLTQYTLAIDRGNEDVQYIYDEMNWAVLKQISRVIRECKKQNVETSICGQAGSKKEMVEFLVKQGIDSISVNADVAKEISELVRKIENGGAVITEKSSNPKDKEISKNKNSDIGDSKIEPIDNRKSVENEIEEREGIEQKRINESQNSNVVVEDLKKVDENLSSKGDNSVNIFD